MSSKNTNKKSDDKNDKEEEALKEAEIVAKLAPDEETRKEAVELIETVETQEIFDDYKQGVLKLTEAISKFQPQYAQSISKLQEEYLQLTKQFIDKVFAAQRNWAGGNVTSTNTTYSKLDIYTICRTI